MIEITLETNAATMFETDAGDFVVYLDGPLHLPPDEDHGRGSHDVEWRERCDFKEAKIHNRVNDAE